MYTRTVFVAANLRKCIIYTKKITFPFLVFFSLWHEVPILCAARARGGRKKRRKKRGRKKEMEAQSLLPSSLQRGSVKKILLFIFLAWNILLFILVVVALSKDSSRHVCILSTLSLLLLVSSLSPSTFYSAPYPLSSPIRHVSHYSFSIFLYLFSALLYLLLPLYFFLCLQRANVFPYNPSFYIFSFKNFLLFILDFLLFILVVVASQKIHLDMYAFYLLFLYLSYSPFYLPYLSFLCPYQPLFLPSKNHLQLSKIRKLPPLLFFFQEFSCGSQKIHLHVCILSTLSVSFFTLLSSPLPFTFYPP